MVGMGTGSRIWLAKQQAKQLRAIERAQAEQSGLPLRKLTFIERHVLGLRDLKPRRRRKG